ncbi:MAG TPA: 30S ribosomal protein S20 [Candidatus Paceibacterota bacterium]
MAITSSAKKALRASARKREFNLARKAAIYDITKKIKRLIKENKATEAKTLLPQAYKTLDKAAKTNFLKKNTASRKKSRLAQMIKRASVTK